MIIIVAATIETSTMLVGGRILIISGESCMEMLDNIIYS